MASMAASDSGNINLNVGGEAVKGPDPSETTIDIIDRDPANMNAHLKVSFEEIFAEPHPTIFSFDGVWTTSYTVFRNTKIWCYRISTLLCAVPAAFVWGIYSALLACCSIWCCRPCTRAFEMELQCFKGFYAAIIGTFVRPCYEAMGFLFYNFRIFLHNGGGPKDNSACS